MNIRDMEYIVAVAKFGHFSKASEYCAISQPTLSTQIKKNENLLGESLFHRSKQEGKVKLTSFGKKILPHIETILKEKEKIKKVAAEHKDPFKGTLKIGAFPTLAPYYLPHILPDLKEKLNNMHLYIIEEKTDRLMDMLLKEDIDAAFLALPTEHNALFETQIFFEPFYLAVPSTHKLASHDVIIMDDILNEKILLLEDGHCLSDQAINFCHMAGIHEFDNFRASSPEMLLEMVRLGTAISIVPKLTTYKKRDNIHFIPFKNKKIGRDIGIIFKKNALHKELEKFLMNFSQNISSSYL